MLSLAMRHRQMQREARQAAQQRKKEKQAAARHINERLKITSSCTMPDESKLHPNPGSISPRLRHDLSDFSPEETLCVHRLSVSEAEFSTEEAVPQSPPPRKSQVHNHDTPLFVPSPSSRPRTPVVIMEPPSPEAKIKFGKKPTSLKTKDQLADDGLTASSSTSKTTKAHHGDSKPAAHRLKSRDRNETDVEKNTATKAKVKKVFSVT